MKLKRLMAAMTFVAAGVATANAVAAVDPAIPSYTKTTGVSGNLSSVGSDTLANLMTLWAENYKKEYPNVNIQIQAAGSATAPPALTEGTSNLGPMSRKIRTPNWLPSNRSTATSQPQSRLPWTPWRCSCTKTTRSST